MKSFSLRRVAHYARYHYSVTRFNYLSYILAMIALPTLFGILGKDLYTTKEMLIPIYIFAGVVMAVTTTRTMRGRGTKIMDGVLPVTAAERHVFNVVNLTVVYPVLFAFVAAVVLGIVSIFNESSWTFCEVYSQLAEDVLLEWKAYVVIQIGCSTALLINICARRSLVFAYALVFFVCFGGLVLFVTGMEWLSDNGYLDWLRDWLNSLDFEFYIDIDESWNKYIEYLFKTLCFMVPAAIYALGYVALRKRQVKW